MHNLGTVSASRLTSAPRLEYTKIHGLSICPYQNQSHFNRILKSYPLPPLGSSCFSPLPRPSAYPRARSRGRTSREKVLQIAPAPACTPHIPAPAHLPTAFIPPALPRTRVRAHSAYPSTCSSTARFSHPASRPSPRPGSLCRLRDRSPAPTAILPAKKCSKSPPRPRAFRISPRPLICQLLSFPCTPPAPASACTPHIPAPAHPPPVFHIPPPARLRARAPSAGSATAPPLPPRYSPRKSAPNRLPAPRLWCRMSLASEA